jgi:hypothetical protein
MRRGKGGVPLSPAAATNKKNPWTCRSRRHRARSQEQNMQLTNQERHTAICCYIRYKLDVPIEAAKRQEVQPKLLDDECETQKLVPLTTSAIWRNHSFRKIKQ